MKPKVNRKGEEATPKGYDACQTPPYALEPLYPYIPENCIVWESACGEGYLGAGLFLCDNVMELVASDILSGHNFFEYQPDNWDVQITNPPYSIKYPWLERSYELGKPFALLLPLETLGAARAQKLFAKYGIEIILMSRRINFKMPQKGWGGSSAQFPTAWFTHGLGIGQQLTFSELNPVKMTDDIPGHTTDNDVHSGLGEGTKEDTGSGRSEDKFMVSRWCTYTGSTDAQGNKISMDSLSDAGKRIVESFGSPGEEYFGA